MRIANKNAHFYVDEKMEFQGNNIFACWLDGMYIVYSYGIHFPIYVFKEGEWYGNEEKYSVTTSKHQSQTRPNAQIKWVKTEELYMIIGD